MKVLIACEFSGIVKKAFLEKGHEAYSCDFIPSDISRNHILGDVLGVIKNGWDLMIAHPPCTYLCNSGVTWLYKNGEINLDRWNKLIKTAEFFKKLLNAPIPKICIENPIINCYALHYIGLHYDQKNTTISIWTC